MEIEVEKKESLISNRKTFDGVIYILLNDAERVKKSLEWLERAKQSVIYYMRKSYSRTPGLVLATIVPYLYIKRQFPLGIDEEDMTDEQNLSLRGVIATLRLMEAAGHTELLKRDFSIEATNRLEYALYLFARKMDELSSERVDGLLKIDILDRVIRHIARENEGTMILFNHTESGEIAKKGDKANIQPMSRPGDDVKPLIFIFYYKDLPRILCYSKKSNTVYFFSQNDKINLVMKRVTAIINGYMGKVKEKVRKMKSIYYKGDIAVTQYIYIPFYILTELSKRLIINNSNLKRSITTIAPWLRDLDEGTMILYKKYFFRTYVFQHWFTQKEEEEEKKYLEDDNDIIVDVAPDERYISPERNDPIIIENDDIIIDNNPNQPPPSPENPVKEDNGNIIIIEYTDIDEEALSKMKLKNPLTSTIVHIATLLDDKHFISETIFEDMFTNYFMMKKDPNVLIVGPRAWGDQISKYNSKEKESAIVGQLRLDFEGKNVILIPIFVDDNHWGLVIILTGLGAIYYYSSDLSDKSSPGNQIKAFYRKTKDYIYTTLTGPRQDCGSVDCAIYVFNMINHFAIKGTEPIDPWRRINKMTKLWTRRTIADFLLNLIRERLANDNDEDALLITREFIIDELTTYKLGKRSIKLTTSFLAIMRDLLRPELYTLVEDEVQKVDTMDKNSLRKRMKSLKLTDKQQPDLLPSVDEKIKKSSEIVQVRTYQTEDPIDKCIKWAIDRLRDIKTLNIWPMEKDFEQFSSLLLKWGYNNYTIDEMSERMIKLFSNGEEIRSHSYSDNDKLLVMWKGIPPKEEEIRGALEKYRQYKR